MKSNSDTPNKEGKTASQVKEGEKRMKFDIQDEIRRQMIKHKKTLDKLAE